jgi:4-hydroxy-3-polyprenylbenzoate decarboxylase
MASKADGGVIVAMTGASGSRYALRTLEVLTAQRIPVHLVVSPGARKVAGVEAGLDLGTHEDSTVGGRFPADAGITRYPTDAVGAAIASGSFPVRGMAVVPCSSGTLGRIAHGLSSNLIERAADVCLKERRTLVLVPRETPLSLVHLKNMTAVTEAGAVVLPAMPGFYHRPETIDDLVDFVVARLLDQLGVEHEVGKRWKG